MSSLGYLNTLKLDIKIFERLKKTPEDYIEEAERLVQRDTPMNQGHSVKIEREGKDCLLEQTDLKTSKEKVFVGQFGEKPLGGTIPLISEYYKRTLTGILAASNDTMRIMGKNPCWLILGKHARPIAVKKTIVEGWE